MHEHQHERINLANASGQGHIGPAQASSLNSQTHTENLRMGNAAAASLTSGPHRASYAHRAPVSSHGPAHGS